MNDREIMREELKRYFKEDCHYILEQLGTDVIRIFFTFLNGRIGVEDESN